MSEVVTTEFDPIADAEASARELFGSNLVCSVAGTALGAVGVERLTHGDIVGFTLLTLVGGVIGIAGNSAKNFAIEDLEKAYGPAEEGNQV